MMRAVKPAAPLSAPPPLASTALVDRLDAALPQTQCTRCGFPDCHAYAEAIADGAAAINRCPPGGAEGIQRLAAISGQAIAPLDGGCGEEGPLALALIDEAWCIGCTLCMEACPVDCIVGANKRMHTVIAEACTGCGLCLPACPVDCIEMKPVDAERTGWLAWSAAQADAARTAYARHRSRLARTERETAQGLAAKAQAILADLPAHTRHTPPEIVDRKRAIIEAALVRARAKAAPT